MSKRKAPPRAAKKDPWSAEQLLTSENSKLIDIDLHGKLAGFFSDPRHWAEVSDADKDYIRSLIPPNIELNDDGSIPTEFWKYNSEFRLDCRNLQEDLRNGRMDPEWQRQAHQAMKERAAGKFDNWKEKEFEEFWGQKQKVDWKVLAGDASQVKLEDMLKAGLFKVGDVWSFDHAFGRGDKGVRIQKDCKIVKIEGKTITFAIPPGTRRYARLLEQQSPAVLTDKEKDSEAAGPSVVPTAEGKEAEAVDPAVVSTDERKEAEGVAPSVAPTDQGKGPEAVAPSVIPTNEAEESEAQASSVVPTDEGNEPEAHASSVVPTDE
ncbi:MAG: hypothetical protein Q9183_005945 [Haloplaca sp. 2 TL-2023]